MTSDNQESISIPAAVTMTELANKIRSIYSKHITFKSTNDEIQTELKRQILEPLNVRTPGGRPKHSLYLKGFAQGIIDGERERIQREYLEFCYLVDGELYSTHRQKDTTRKTTREFYDANNGHILSNAPNGFYWKGSDKPYFTTDKSEPGA